MAVAWDFSPLEHALGVVRLLLIACGPLPLCAAWIAAEPARSAPRRLLMGLLLWWLVQADLALLAGWVHRYDVWSICALELGLIGVGALVLLPHRAGWRVVVGDAQREARRVRGPERMLILALAIIGIGLLWHAAATPVVDWDSWAFHMPAMARWLQAGEFVRLEQYALRPRNAYPYTWEAISALFMMPFGEDVLVTLPNLVAWVVLGTATFAAARDMSATRLHGLAAAAFVMLMPHLLGQVNAMHVDLPFAAAFAAALSCALSYPRRRRRSDLALFVAALGLMCSMRATGAMYGAFLALFLVVLTRRSQPVVRAFAAGAPGLMVFCIVSALFVGSFWSLKNLADFGRLFGPIAMRASEVSDNTFDKPLTEIASGALLFAFAPLQAASWAMLAERGLNELGLQLPIILAQLALWPLALYADRRALVRRTAWLAGALVVASVALFVATPTSAISGVQFRMGFPAMVALAVAGAAAATFAHLPEIVSAFLAIVIAVAGAATSRVFQLAAVLLIPLAAVRSRRPARRGAALPAVAAVLLLGLTLLVARELRAQRRIDNYGPAFAYLEQHVGDDEPVGYPVGSRSYFFYGRHLRRPVRFVPLPPEGPTPAWFAQLRAAGIRTVLVGPYGGEEGEPDNLARLQPPHGELERVVGNGRPDEISVYRFAAR